MSNEAKEILDRWATIVLKKDAIYADPNGEARPNQEKNKHYQDCGYSEDIVLWIPPKDCLRLEFESTPDENRKWIAEIESSAKSLGYDYCITEHAGAKSPYFNMFNIKGMPLNEDNRLAKLMLVEQLCPNEKARGSLDKTNLGWTFSPVIEHPHWKPKYNGASHRIIRGTRPSLHENTFPKELLRDIKKSKTMVKKATRISSDNWVINFLTRYCVENKLPQGERHNVIEKNLAIAIIHHPERDRLEREYVKIQNQPMLSLQGWYSAIIRGAIKEINASEIAKYIKRNNIPFDIPELLPVCDGSAGAVAPALPDKDGWIEVGGGLSANNLPAKPFVVLPISDKLISAFAEEVVEELVDKHELFYRYREFKVQKLEKMPVKDIKNRDVRILGFKDITPNALVTHIEKFVVPCIITHNRQNGEENFERRSIGSELARSLLESEVFKDNLPLIDVIYDVPLPMLVDGKLIFPKEGYDERFQSWLPPGAPKIDPEMPLPVAIETINSIFGEFCFETPDDKARAIAGLLTPFIRGLYVRNTCRTPIFFYKANRERAGKDYCAEITGLVYQGVANSEPPLADGKETHDEEFRKKILSTFRLGKNRLHMSNNKGFLNSAQLEFISTNENFSDRVLGSNTTLTFPNTLELSLSANTGITYTPDLSNRCVFVNLFLDLENPNDRNFKRPDLHGWVKNHRSEVLSAMFALVKNWYDKGMPSGTTLFSSYPEWARVCGGIMGLAGLGDPCIMVDDSAYIGGDTETKDMKRLFELAYERWGSQPIYKKQILNVMIDGSDEAFREIFGYLDWSKEQSARVTMGKIIDKYVGRIFSGIRLKRVEDSHNERRTYIWSKVEKRTSSTGNEVPSEAGVIGVIGVVSSPSGLQTTLNINSTNINFNKSWHSDRVESHPNLPQPPQDNIVMEEQVAENPHQQNQYLNDNTENIKSLKDKIMNYLASKKNITKISELQNDLDLGFDEAIEAIEKLKETGEITETPSGTIRRFE